MPPIHAARQFMLDFVAREGEAMAERGNLWLALGFVAGLLLLGIPSGSCHTIIRGSSIRD